MALDPAQEIIIPLKPLLRCAGGMPREELFRDTGVAFLPLTHFQQVDEQGNFIDSWCYAACAQMVFDFYHKNVKQCEIAGFVKGPVCCSPFRPAVCTDDGCDHPDIARIYDHWGITSTPHLEPAGRISWDALKQEINAGRPVEVVKEWTSEPGSFHAIIIIGYSEPLRKVMYHDPASESAGELLAFDELTDSIDFKWDSTWTGLTRK